MRIVDNEEYKRIVLGILIKIDRICRDNGLKYMLFYGTLLGAIRHKGFIPWDDDADIIMPRNDYDKLCKIINEGNYGISFIDVNYNPDTIYPFGKICDLKTVIYEKNFKHVDGYGAFVDVFPYDKAPDNKKKSLKEKKVLFQLERLIVHSSRTGYDKSDSVLINMERKTAYLFGKIFDTRRLIMLFNSYLSSHSQGESKTIRILWGDIFPEEDIEKIIEVEFEGHMFFAPQNWDLILKKLFNNYMQLPKAEDRINKHGLTCYVK